jgi:ABC-2 type transport system permease protein
MTWQVHPRLCKLATAHTPGHMAYTTGTERGMYLATYTYNGKKSFAREFVDSLATFYRKRWLLRYFVRRQVTRSYKRSYLGLAWAILGPLVWVFFLTLIFSKGLGIRFRVVDSDPTLNFGLFLYCGLLPFMAYSEALSKGLNTIRSNSGLVQKVVFPLELLPFTNAFASLIDKVFGVGALAFIVFLIQHRLHWQILLLPLIMVLQLLFTLGLTYLMAVIGTYVPDMGEVMRPIIRGTFFITPILWPPERLPENLRWIEDYNPLAYLVEAYRNMILEGTLPGGLATLYFALFSVAVFLVGFALFVRLKAGFADQL